MKFYHVLLFVGTLAGQFSMLNAQSDSMSSDTTTYYIGTIEGGQFMGKILSKNDREYLIETKDKGNTTSLFHSLPLLIRFNFKDFP